MARRKLQYFEWDDQGSTTYYSPGHIDGGSFDNDGGISWETGMGGVATEVNEMIAPTGSVDFRPTDGTFLNKCLRSTWTANPSALHIRCGTDSEAYQHQYAYASRLQLKCSVGQRLSATMDWMAVTPGQIAVPTWTAWATGNPFHWHQGVITVNSAELSMQDFTLDIGHNLTPHSSLDEKTAGSQRHAEEITAHNITWTFSCTVHVPPSSNYMSNWGDAPSAHSGSVVLTSVTPTVLTTTLTNMRLKNWRMGLVRNDGVVSWVLDYEGKTNTCPTIVPS